MFILSDHIYRDPTQVSRFHDFKVDNLILMVKFLYFFFVCRLFLILDTCHVLQLSIV